ncbi:multicomponent Na+:H+ antiporter subunit C [Desulfitispora alkaliphila]|uniref:Na(+)/H(+) antiporter subunit C n=1 Tax=Desulfitispora alkaliphila TaxID=622674 RepID=UPI003D1CE3D8
MELIMSLVVGVLFASGTYLVLTRSLLRVILGTALINHGAFLMLLTMGGLKQGLAPVLIGPGQYSDPLPQALILTAIVIGFGVTAFVLVLAYRTYQELGTDDLDKLRGVDDE